jgi:MerR family transcriptional regulator/heat shock protein HspR
VRQDPRTDTGRSSPIWERIVPPAESNRPRTNVRPPPPKRRSPEEDTTPQEGLYIISVAARILDMHPQTLRKYERVGLVRPSRTVGMLRLYSEDDVTQLRLIKHLVEQLRLNLAGVELVMDMMRQLMAFQQRLAPARHVAWQELQKELETILDSIHYR